MKNAVKISTSRNGTRVTLGVKLLFISNIKSFRHAYENYFSFSVNSDVYWVGIMKEDKNAFDYFAIKLRKSNIFKLKQLWENNKIFFNPTEVGIEKWDFYVHGEWKFRTAGTAYANKACRSTKTEQLKFYQITKKNQKKVEKFFFIKIDQNEREFISESHNRKLFVRIFSEKWTGNAEWT